jgi:hypothetical protein
VGKYFAPISGWPRKAKWRRSDRFFGFFRGILGARPWVCGSCFFSVAELMMMEPDANLFESLKLNGEIPVEATTFEIPTFYLGIKQLYAGKNDMKIHTLAIKIIMTCTRNYFRH